jgi:hypothetical protein
MRHFRALRSTLTLACPGWLALAAVLSLHLLAPATLERATFALFDAW